MELEKLGDLVGKLELIEKHLYLKKRISEEEWREVQDKIIGEIKAELKK